MTADAAGPVEAVLTEALAPHVYEAYRVGKFGTEDYLPMWHEKPAAEHAVPWPEVHAAAAALAPLFAEHGAAERRAGAVEALNEAADETLASPSTRLGDLHPGRVWADWLRARAAALGGRADEAVES